MTLNEIADAYVKLVLATGLHDSGYVDAYYGPTEWQTASSKQPLNDLLSDADQLLAQLLQHISSAPVADAEQQWRADF